MKTGSVGAQLPHLRKYSEQYQVLYPSAKQLIVRSEPNDFWKSSRSRRASSRPAIDWLNAEMSESPTPGLLVHMFSNGGARQLTTMTEDLRGIEVASGEKPPTTCLVFDSCPGHPSLRIALRAFSTTFKYVLLKLLARIVAAVLLSSLALVYIIARKPHIIKALREKLNHPRLLPWTSVESCRLYLYSDTDKLVPSGSVEEHIAEAKAKGLNVRAVLFKGSPHVAHARVYPERYWNAIQAAWTEAKRSI